MMAILEDISAALAKYRREHPKAKPPWLHLGTSGYRAFGAAWTIKGGKRGIVPRTYRNSEIVRDINIDGFMLVPRK